MNLNLPDSKRRVPKMSVLRKVLTQAVEDSGYKQVELARRSGLNHKTINYILKGKRGGTIETWSRILEAAGVEIGYRIRRDDERLSGGNVIRSEAH